jgi:hypothetical protein
MNMMADGLTSVPLFVAYFTLMDYACRKLNLKNPYYIVHAIHNAIIVAATAPDVYHTFTDLYNITSYPTNWLAIKLCFALHLYHIMLYFQSFRFDDWLHHGLMIGFALPIGSIVPAHTLMGFSLFFTTGLPGGIDYALLALVRNEVIPKPLEKVINTWLNVWIRSPGCVAMASLGAASFLSNKMGTNTWALIPCALNYWNGQYFMRQVVEDYAKLRP